MNTNDHQDFPAQFWFDNLHRGQLLKNLAECLPKKNESIIVNLLPKKENIEAKDLHYLEDKNIRWIDINGNYAMTFIFQHYLNNTKVYISKTFINERDDWCEKEELAGEWADWVYDIFTTIHTNGRAVFSIIPFCVALADYPSGEILDSLDNKISVKEYNDVLDIIDTNDMWLVGVDKSIFDTRHKMFEKYHKVRESDQFALYEHIRLRPWDY